MKSSYDFYETHTTVSRSLRIDLKCEEQVLNILHVKQQSRKQAAIYLGRRNAMLLFHIKIYVNMFCWSMIYDLRLSLLSLSYTLESPWLRIAPTENTKCICIIYSTYYIHTHTHIRIHTYIHTVYTYCLFTKDRVQCIRSNDCAEEILKYRCA